MYVRGSVCAVLTKKWRGGDKKEERHEEQLRTKTSGHFGGELRTAVGPFNRLCDSCQAHLFDRCTTESTAKNKEKEG